MTQIHMVCTATHPSSFRTPTNGASDLTENVDDAARTRAHRNAATHWNYTSRLHGKNCFHLRKHAHFSFDCLSPNSIVSASYHLPRAHMVLFALRIKHKSRYGLQSIWKWRGNVTSFHRVGLQLVCARHLSDSLSITHTISIRLFTRSPIARNFKSCIQRTSVPIYGNFKNPSWCRIRWSRATG